MIKLCQMGLGLLLVTVLGCAHTQSQSTLSSCSDATGIATLDSPDCGIVVETGRPNRFVDGVGWVWGIPDKLLLWDRRVNNHDVSPETTESVTEYLAAHGVENTCVRINQYAPGEEWRRLTQNKQVGAGWRYTIGTLSLIGYTIIPGRIVGGDHYNPYTNSVYIYSDVPSLAMKSAAYTHDVQGRRYPGTYAAANELPIVSLWHETRNTRDALKYIEQNQSGEQQAEGLRILHPYYGSQVGLAVGDLAGGGGLLFEVGGALVGHATGRYEARRRLRETTEPSQSVSALVPEEPEPMPHEGFSARAQTSE